MSGWGETSSEPSLRTADPLSPGDVAAAGKQSGRGASFYAK
jgi:hypothetical protein